MAFNEDMEALGHQVKNNQDGSTTYIPSEKVVWESTCPNCGPTAGFSRLSKCPSCVDKNGNNLTITESRRTGKAPNPDRDKETEIKMEKK